MDEKLGLGSVCSMHIHLVFLNFEHGKVIGAIDIEFIKNNVKIMVTLMCHLVWNHDILKKLQKAYAKKS